ncbi:MAG: alpha/beta hydrolase [Firmicutes bacterium]|nr:alpha/beta hydrolase [Bacillota bacterium]
MIKQNLLIENIPAILWGENSTKIMVAVHGNMSSKTDVPIAMLAEEAIPLGYQVLSFDLPQHGDRKEEITLCKVQNCVQDLYMIMDFAIRHSNHISLFACSMGVYFSLLTYKDVPIRRSLFLSPIVDMSRIIDNMMTWFNVSEEKLQAEQEIQTPLGHALYWDYYCYVKENPVDYWNSPTAILYGKEDNFCEFDIVSSFATRFACSLAVMEKGEHYFHTPDQLKFYREWLKENLQ